jgi:hypothetical protein
MNLQKVVLTIVSIKVLSFLFQNNIQEWFQVMVWLVGVLVQELFVESWSFRM